MATNIRRYLGGVLKLRRLDIRVLRGRYAKISEKPRVPYVGSINSGKLCYHAVYKIILIKEQEHSEIFPGQEGQKTIFFWTEVTKAAA